MGRAYFLASMSRDEQKRDELLKRLWQMPPKPHAKITPKAKKKAKRKKKPAK